MAMVMVLSLAPGALAVDPPNTSGGTTTAPGTENPGGNENQDPVDPTPTPPAHTHTPGTAWVSNESSHWHVACTDETCESKNSKADEAPHSFGDPVVEEAATCAKEGKQVETCTVCLYEKTTYIAKVAHKFDETGKCTVCGEYKDVTIELTNSTLALILGNTEGASLVARVTPSSYEITSQIEWTVSNPAIIEVRRVSNTSVNVIPVAVGSATVTASVNGKSASCIVSVTTGDKKVTISGSSNTISTINNTLQLTARVTQGTNTEALPDPITWTSSNESVATVDSRGLVTARRAGKTIIRAALTADPKVYDSWEITVSNP